MPEAQPTTIHWVIDHWPFALSLLTAISATGVALYVALKVKLPDFASRIDQLEATMSDAIKTAQLHTAIAKMEGNCALYREDCQNAICSKLETLRADLRVMHKEYEAARSDVQKQAVIMARVDERVKLLLGQLNGSVASVLGNAGKKDNT